MKTQDWVKALEAARAGTSLPAPSDEWITMRQFQQMRGGSRASANEGMRLLLSSGKAESKKFTIRDGDTLRSIPHYRLLKKK